MIDKFKTAFKEEAYELLSQLEDTFLELESHPLDLELINAAFRAIHTVKGSSGMFGYDTISRFTHEVETALDRCREGSLDISKDLIGLTLQARDHIRKLLDFEEPVPEDIVREGEALLGRLVGFIRGSDATAAEPQQGKAKAAEKTAPKAQRESEPGETSTFRVRFKPKPGIFMDGTRVLNLLEEIAGLGQAENFPDTSAIPELGSMDAEKCYCGWDSVLTTTKDENAIRDVFIFVEDQAEISIERLEVSEAGDSEEGTKRLGEILVERGAVSGEALRDALKSQKRLGEVLIEKHIVSKPQVESALMEQEHLKKVREHGEGVAASIRVASDKLDALVDLVGELVTLQARLQQTALGLKDAGIASITEQFERLISQLRDNTMSIRMLPIGSTFNKFRRVVRDLSLELGKEAELVAEGADTELDKTVIERLGDPLVHIIRNSLDHGIEAPDFRERAGKSRMGTIKLAARHSGASVLIQVSDDGKGLDREAIRNKAIERGLIAPAQELPDKELYNLIFEPNFSTAKVVTTVSGRGVGMDVVKREIDTLGGSVQLDTLPGKGMTITLKIPLTLAIIEGLLVRIDREFFVIPLSSVDGCIEMTRDELVRRGERRIIEYRDELVPYVSLRSYFASLGEEPAIEQIVIATAHEARVGFVVDQVVGDYQTVIKPLGRMFRDVEGISGATILGDGTVALVLDVNRLSSMVQRETGRKLATGV
jgi:two-component system chemotaxis sensor kinase CheA